MEEKNNYKWIKLNNLNMWTCSEPKYFKAMFLDYNYRQSITLFGQKKNLKCLI